MAAVEMRKTKVELNKPRYVGMTILNLSKIVMYNFHYKFILPKYPGATLLLMSQIVSVTTYHQEKTSMMK